MKPEDVLNEIDEDDLRENFIKYTIQAFQALPVLDSPKILDIGCGSGVPTIELAKRSGGEVIGLDIDETEIKNIYGEDFYCRHSIDSNKCAEIKETILEFEAINLSPFFQKEWYGIKTIDINRIKVKITDAVFTKNNYPVRSYLSGLISDSLGYDNNSLNIIRYSQVLSEKDVVGIKK